MVVPILVLLIMGIVDYAVLFNQKIGLRGGVREAAWNGSRGIFGAAPNASCSLTFTGVLDDNTQRIMCMVKRRSGLDQSEVRVKVRIVDLDTPAAPATFTNGRGLMVCAMRKASSTTHFFSSLFTNTYQSARLTAIVISINPAVTTVAGGEETPFATNANGWTFCDPTRPAPH